MCGLPPKSHSSPSCSVRSDLVHPAAAALAAGPVVAHFGPGQRPAGAADPAKKTLHWSSD